MPCPRQVGDIRRCRVAPSISPRHGHGMGAACGPPSLAPGSGERGHLHQQQPDHAVMPVRRRQRERPEPGAAGLLVGRRAVLERPAVLEQQPGAVVLAVGRGVHQRGRPAAVGHRGQGSGAAPPNPGEVPPQLPARPRRPLRVPQRGQPAPGRALRVGRQPVQPPAPSARVLSFCCTPSTFSRCINSDGERASAE